jgi:serine/threonine-protein kinase RsbW
VGVIVKAVTYTIKHDIKTLASTIDLVLSAIMSEHCMSDQMLFEIKVVLNELIVNALCHGNNCELGKVTYVTFKLVPGSYLYISVKDEGCGFKPNIDIVSLDDYIEATNKSLCEHGRGLVIVERLCDRVKFNRCGNKVSIFKSLQ